MVHILCITITILWHYTIWRRILWMYTIVLVESGFTSGASSDISYISGANWTSSKEYWNKGKKECMC